MIAKKTKKWLDLLPKITASYNDSFHRSIGMKPNDVTKNKEAEIWNRLYMPKPRKLKAPKTNESSTSREKPFTYSIGDTVKVTTDTHKFSKGYNKRWSDENFQIAGRYIKQGKEVYSKTLKMIRSKEVGILRNYSELQFRKTRVMKYKKFLEPVTVLARKSTSFIGLDGIKSLTAGSMLRRLKTINKSTHGFICHS